MLRIYLDLQPDILYQMMHELLRFAYPNSLVLRAPDLPLQVYFQLRAVEQESQVHLYGFISGADKNTRWQESHPLSAADRHNDLRRAVRSFAYRLLCEHEERDINPYGVLTGLRPMKPVHRLIDKGYAGEELVQELQQEYLMERSKASLMTSIAEFNHAYLLDKREARRKVSVYIGIPFCPSQCYYCSFPGAVLQNYGRDILPFMEALHQEMQAMAAYMDQSSLVVQSIYIGGGTPTVLEEAELSRLFQWLHEYLISEETEEITLEAGRPDTLERHLLQRCQEWGVQRLCLNPQTMHDRTLRRIGRHHTADDIFQAVEWARQVDIPTINMDLILGLPGEEPDDFMYSLREVLRLKPENLTIHSLAVKKGSRLARKEGNRGVFKQIKDIQGAVQAFRLCLNSHGYRPYYLYRQKYIKGNVENIGYALPGHTSIYNIQMMEERQTIIGLGGGAASKFIQPEDWTLTAFHNPKDPISYCQSIPRLVQAKVDKLRALN